MEALAAADVPFDLLFNERSLPVSLRAVCKLPFDYPAAEPILQARRKSSEFVNRLLHGAHRPRRQQEVVQGAPGVEFEHNVRISADGQKRLVPGLCVTNYLETLAYRTFSLRCIPML